MNASLMKLTQLIREWNLTPWMLLLVLNIFFLVNGLWI